MLRRLTSSLQQDSVNFQPWLHWQLENALEGHTLELNGVFDRAFLKQIANVLEMSLPETEELWARFTDSASVAVIRRGRLRAVDMQLVVKAYLTSGLLRGLYYDYLARAMGSQVMHHPLRETVLFARRNNEETFSVSNTAWYLSQVVVAAARREATLKSRLDSWAESVVKVRRRALTGEIDLRHKDSMHVARNIAMETARKCDIRFAPRYVEDALDATAALGTGILTSFVLSPWIGFGFGMAAYAVARKRRVGESIAGLIYRPELQKMADATPGRIRRRWTSV